MKKRFIIFFLLIVIFVGLFFAWFNEGLRPVNPVTVITKQFVIAPGSTLKDIADKLEREELIRSKVVFFLYVRYRGFAKKIQAGLYRLSPSMDVSTVATTLTKGTNDIWITTLEGWRDAEIATKLSKDLGIPEHEFLKYAKEGFMFPETYLIQRSATASAVVKLFLDTFNQKVTGEMREDTKKNGLTFEEALILASIIEREGKTDNDRPMIAGILLKRLKADWPLQADATLQYALGYQADQNTWWKKELLNEDKQIDSPYNTYKRTGLPPTPICNPGLASIKAAIYPKMSDYWYYLHSPNGDIHYAKTLEEHEENTQKYLR